MLIHCDSVERSFFSGVGERHYPVVRIIGNFRLEKERLELGEKGRFPCFYICGVCLAFKIIGNDREVSYGFENLTAQDFPKD